jgi:alpha-galactosidase
MVLSGDDLSKISAAHLAILRKLLPPTGVAARFENDRFDVGRIALPGHEMVAVFNWSDHPSARSIHLTEKSEIKDYWTDAKLGAREGDYVIPEMPGHSARLLVLTPVSRKQTE